MDYVSSIDEDEREDVNSSSDEEDERAEEVENASAQAEELKSPGTPKSTTQADPRTSAAIADDVKS